MKYAACSVVASVLCTTAAADAISVTSSSRTLNTFARAMQFNDDHLETITDTHPASTNAFGPYNASVNSFVPQGYSSGEGNAAQNTDVGPGGVSGTGSARGWGFSAGLHVEGRGDADSALSVPFSIASLTSFNLVGELHSLITTDTNSPQDNFYHPSGYIRVTTSTGTLLYGIAVDEFSLNASINQSFALAPGSYKIEADAFANAIISHSHGQCTTNFSFSFTPVPAPGAAALLPLAVISLTRRRRR